MISALKKSVGAALLALTAACSSTPPDPFAQYTAQEQKSDQTLTSTAAAFAEKYPPSAVGHCESLTHTSYEEGTRCYRVINRNWERDYKEAYSHADKRTRAMLKRYHTSFSAYYLAPSTTARRSAADRAYQQLLRRIGS